MSGGGILYNILTLNRRGLALSVRPIVQNLALAELNWESHAGMRLETQIAQFPRHFLTGTPRASTIDTNPKGLCIINTEINTILSVISTSVCLISHSI